MFSLTAINHVINSSTECFQITVEMVEQQKLKSLITTQSASTANYEAGDTKNSLNRRRRWRS